MTWSVITGLCSLTLEVHHRPAAFMCLWKPLSRKMRASETRSHTTYQYYKHHPGSHFPSFFVFLVLVLCLTKAPIVHDRISIWWKLKAGVALLFHLGGSRGGAEDFVSPRPLSFCGACSSRSTSLSHVILAFWLVFGALCLCLFFVWVTHSLLLFTSSISQVVGHTDKRSPHSLTSLLT